MMMCSIFWWNANLPLKDKFFTSKVWVGWCFKKRSIWLNLGCWKKPTIRIFPGSGPTTFLFDYELDSFSFTWSTSTALFFCILQQDKVVTIHVDLGNIVSSAKRASDARLPTEKGLSGAADSLSGGFQKGYWCVFLCPCPGRLILSCVPLSLYPALLPTHRLQPASRPGGPVRPLLPW